MESLSNNISVLVIKKGQGVLDAIVAIAKKNGISYTRKELYTLGGEICARLDQDKLRADCLVQPGQLIQIKDITPIQTGIKVESGIVKGIGGLTKTKETDGTIRYTFVSNDGITREFK